jgi:hypothetical protein
MSALSLSTSADWILFPQLLAVDADVAQDLDDVFGELTGYGHCNKFPEGSSRIF